MQRYDTIFIYPNELTLINIILCLYTFSITYIYARTLYKTKHRQTDGTPVPNESPKRTNTKRKISL